MFHVILVPSVERCCNHKTKVQAKKPDFKKSAWVWLCQATRQFEFNVFAHNSLVFLSRLCKMMHFGKKTKLCICEYRFRFRRNFIHFSCFLVVNFRVDINTRSFTRRQRSLLFCLAISFAIGNQLMDENRSKVEQIEFSILASYQPPTSRSLSAHLSKEP